MALYFIVVGTRVCTFINNIGALHSSSNLKKNYGK